MKSIRPRPVKEYALGIYDGPHATPAESSEGAVFLGVRNITDDGRLDLSEIRHVSEHDFPKWTKRVLPSPGDVVLTYEATLHRYAIIPEGFRGCLGRRVALVRPDPKKVDGRYLLYYFLSRQWHTIVESYVITGATVDRIPIEKLPEFPVALPELAVQLEVASILSAYDDLIENNRRRMKLLEDAARLLYQEWFVRLRFPGHERVRVKDGVLEGWNAGILGDIVDVKKGKNITRESVNEGTVPVVAGGLSPAYYHDSFNAVGPVITISASGANSGYVNLYHEDIWASDCSYITKDSTDCLYCLYLLLKSKQAEIFGMQKGAAQPHVYPKDLVRLPVTIAPPRITGLFEEAVEPMFTQVENLLLQNRQLRAARDLLLPRLMSGEVGVVAERQ